MKKIKLLAVLFLTTSILIFSSCKKDDKPCNCGIITDDAIEFDSNGTTFYTLTITNDCSNNSGKYYFNYDVWLNAPVGSYFCVTNVSSWMPVGETTIERVENKEIE
jgi:hypothetical protein